MSKPMSKSGTSETHDAVLAADEDMPGPPAQAAETEAGMGAEVVDAGPGHEADIEPSGLADSAAEVEEEEGRLAAEVPLQHEEDADGSAAVADAPGGSFW
jgi:hypothetical protein